jgi:hypothetical protein
VPPTLELQIETRDPNDQERGGIALAMTQNPFYVINEATAGVILTNCLNAVTDARIADALLDAPQSAEQLAKTTATHAGALNRMLRFLAAYGIFEAREGGWAHSPASRFLRTDHPQSLRGYVLLCALPSFQKGFASLAYSLRTGQPAIEKISPEGFWKLLESNPEDARIFNEGMAVKARGQVAGVVAHYDFARFGTIADIGGGHGHLLQAVLAAAPKSKGILFDQPSVIEEAAGIASDRLRLQAGDFFTDAHPVADLYLIMQVIHDWNDEDSVRILSGIRRSAPAHATLLLVEAVVPDPPKPDWALLVDLTMLALLHGRERTRNEYQKLLASAGFRLARAIDVGQSTAILEAVPV